MIGLAIHTSSPELGLALTEPDGQYRQQVWPLGRDLSTYLHTCLTNFLGSYDWQDICFIAVAKGPGGFTGTRIGVVTARTLAQHLNIPLFGIGSLDAIAHQTLKHQPLPPSSDLAVQMTAQRGEVYGAIYRPAPQQRSLICLEATTIYKEADWQLQLRQWERPTQIVNLSGGCAHSVTSVLQLAEILWAAGERPDWQTTLPYYGQHPVDP